MGLGVTNPHKHVININKYWLLTSIGIKLDLYRVSMIHIALAIGPFVGIAYCLWPIRWVFALRGWIRTAWSLRNPISFFRLGHFQHLQRCSWGDVSNTECKQ